MRCRLSDRNLLNLGIRKQNAQSMKSYTLFQEYIWLVSIISRSHRISLNEINHKWQRSELSGGLPMPRTTFNRHKAAIEDIFGILIECDVHDDYRYHIANPEALGDDSIQNWMMNTLSVNNILSENKEVHHRILLESIPSNGVHLSRFIEAMKAGKRVTINYRKYGSDEANSRTVDPYCVKLFNRRWYALVKHLQKGTLFMLAFDRIEQLEITDESFTLDKDFDAQTYFSDCYGIVRNPDSRMERIIFRAYGREAFYQRDLPFHHSQREIAAEDGYSDFEIYLRPTSDFYTPLLSRGPNIKVLEPQWLADEIKRQLIEAARLY